MPRNFARNQQLAFGLRRPLRVGRAGLSNAPTNYTDPSGERTRAEWQELAQKEIAGYLIKTGGVTTGPDAAIIRNRYISAAYAKMYKSDPSKFAWAGLAALASREVGQGMCESRREIRELQKFDWRPSSLAAINIGYLKDISGLFATGNKAVYDDIYWQFLAYREGGIKEMKSLADAGELTPAQFKAWEQIDGGKVTNGTLILFDREQNVILEQSAFSKFPPGSGGQLAAFTLPLFPGATPFKNVGTNLADQTQRWSWASKTLLPEWLAYHLGDGKECVSRKMDEIIGNAK